MKKIAIINGHPNRNSFNSGLANAYKNGAVETGASIKEINISELDFNPNLQFGYQARMVLEPDLMEAWEIIKWADHLLWIHPIWWGGLPAITKGFIDRLFLPGLAFKYRPNSVFWDKLLLGKTAHIISTLDQPSWYYRIFYGQPSVNQLKKTVLQFCGVSPVRVTYIAIIKSSNERQRSKWLDKVKSFGKRLL
ncbi:NAD(P)H-dependent oxidoreductase [Sphingobacterium sp. SRCM116780]|uniref:NAD(P)H-dependent oxidoreductase n=1 Tax=Sphingobacterium sp. SRCM116780 TaxID=2907623 RepID=UPI001F1587C5|nr:NAD(P)H-dependent oxidoreductase [Sphingobacterium sp. SRCM116780]UIR57290.1 NAD(P)H-dependent oxidoreductase [Sphingobacterium sp. SRCM116780]